MADHDSPKILQLLHLIGAGRQRLEPRVDGLQTSVDRLEIKVDRLDVKCNRLEARP